MYDLKQDVTFVGLPKTMGMFPFSTGCGWDGINFL